MADRDFFTRYELKVRATDKSTDDASDKRIKLVEYKVRDAQLRFRESVDRQLESRGFVRIIVEKCRKLGISTDIQAIGFHQSQSVAYTEMLVMAQSDPDTRKLFAISKRFWENCNPDVRQPLLRGGSKIPTGSMIEFANGSVIECRTQGGAAGGKGRGGTPNFIHLSELPSWEIGRRDTSTAEIAQGLLSSVEPDPGTFIFLEATPRGAYGLFYQRWLSAVRKERGNLYEPIFFEWQKEKSYFVVEHNPLAKRQKDAWADALRSAHATQDSSAVAAYAKHLEYSPLQTERALRFGLTHEQVAFWQQKLVNDCGGDNNKFDEEYPLSWEIGFVASGGAYFDARAIRKRLDEVQSIPFESGLFVENGLAVELDGDSDAWHVFKRPVLGHRYLVTCDAAEGGTEDKDDYSPATVLDCTTGEQVAFMYDRLWPDTLADQVDMACRFYGADLIAPERNNHGLAVLMRLRNLRNPNGTPRSVPLYHQTLRVAQSTSSWSGLLGFSTDQQTRPLLWPMFRSAFKNGSIIIYDSRLLGEMLTVIKRKGRPEAGPGEHDDGCMATAISVFIQQERSSKDDTTPQALPDERIMEPSTTFLGYDTETPASRWRKDNDEWVS